MAHIIPDTNPGNISSGYTVGVSAFEFSTNTIVDNSKMPEKCAKTLKIILSIVQMI
jgi:hypothetical protein